MNMLRSKKDAENFVDQAKDLFKYDEAGKKFYFVFEDHSRDGNWTIMFYPKEERWTSHSFGENYCDEGETELTREEMNSFIFKNRKYVNRALKNLEPVLVKS
ncbi:hypothetical protein [Jeotgalibacillus campisalis]|uniref:Uncharacterized protein n=1 Tax=Jeotgalibacillus campisalis TaxID=220754 RepID=A0A0C2VJC4_9BACL|nr:hypothetical protein [Jeotgalibacillus campisalis]KIL44093.1 hypothetical protein KR50_31510 [Jeotgalibacillus campisalis]